MTKVCLLAACLLFCIACPGTENGNNSESTNSSVQNTNPSGGGPGSTESPTTSNNGSQSNDSYAPPVFNGTTKKTTKRKNLENPAILGDVRTGKHTGFDRVVFEFKGAEMPGYYIEYVGEPITQCGSGDSVDLGGNPGLEIRFSPAQAHTEDGKPTLFFSDNEQSPYYPMLRKVKSTCDFEGNVTWVAGVTKANKYRVIELENPTRLAVDIER